MRGFLTERDLTEAEEAFPGILEMYRSLTTRPRTFLELVFAYQRRFAGKGRAA